LNATNDKAELRQKVLTDPVMLLAFGLGTGLAPKAPGTFGSLFGLALAWWTLPLGLELRLMVAVALIASGFWLCGEAARLPGAWDLPCSGCSISGNHGRFGTWITDWAEVRELCWMTSLPLCMPQFYWVLEGGFSAKEKRKHGTERQRIAATQ